MAPDPPAPRLQVEHAAAPGWTAVALAHPGLRRTSMDDAFALALGLAAPGGVVHAAGVFDGVGGLPHGEEAAVAAAQALGPLVRKGTPDAELLAALHAVVEATGGMTTAVVALARGGGQVGLVAVGDSSAYALRPDGSLERLVPHDADPDGLTACLGMAPLRRQARPWVLAPGQAMLLCTDGVDKVVPPEALAAALRAQDMEAALRTLLAQVLDEKAPDNLAAVLLRRVA